MFFVLFLLYYGDLIIRNGVILCNFIDRRILKMWYMVLVGILVIIFVIILVLYIVIGFKFLGWKFFGNVS